MTIIMKIVIQKITKNSSLYIVYLFILISAWFAMVQFNFSF